MSDFPISVDGELRGDKFISPFNTVGFDIAPGDTFKIYLTVKGNSSQKYHTIDASGLYDDGPTPVYYFNTSENHNVIIDRVNNIIYYDNIPYRFDNATNGENVYGVEEVIAIEVTNY